MELFLRRGGIRRSLPDDEAHGQRPNDRLVRSVILRCHSRDRGEPITTHRLSSRGPGPDAPRWWCPRDLRISSPNSIHPDHTTDVDCRPVAAGHAAREDTATAWANRPNGIPKYADP